MTSFWEGQASVAEEGIFMVCYSNWVGECVCVFLKFLSLFASLLCLKKNKPQNPTFILLSFLSYLLFPPSALHCCLYVLLLLFIALLCPVPPPGAKLFQSWYTWLALLTTCCSQCEAFVLPLSGTIWIGYFPLALVLRACHCDVLGQHHSMRWMVLH